MHYLCLLARYLSFYNKCSIITLLIDCYAQMNKLKKRFHYAMRLCVLLLCLHCIPAHTDPYRLPDISDPSYATMSLAKEKKLGRVILAGVRSSLPIIDDIEIQSYLRHLGKRILAHGEDQTLDFHFLAVRSPAINAFASPGGVLAFNEGLILSAETESELGGVVAHEIAHVVHRHIARLQALTEGSSLISTLSIIGALIAAAYNSEFAEFTLFGGSALPIERRLSYTRSFEYEADRFGMQMMAAARLDPAGMPTFFAKLQKLEGRNQQIEFLRTHPLTVSRLSDAQTRAAQYRGPFAKDSEAFHYTRARLLALSKTTGITKYRNKDDENIGNYYKALIAIERQSPRQAIEYLEKIPAAQQNIPVKLAFAHAYRTMEAWDEAITLLDKLDSLHPGRAPTIYYLALSLLKNNQAQKALEKINANASLHTYYPQFYQLGAQSAAQLERRSEYHEYLADYYAAEGYIEPALRQLDLAERSDTLHQTMRFRIAAKRKDWEELRREM